MALGDGLVWCDGGWRVVRGGWWFGMAVGVVVDGGGGGGLVLR